MALALLEQLPHLAFPDLEGRSVRLGQFQGKKLLLIVWSSW